MGVGVCVVGEEYVCRCGCVCRLVRSMCVGVGGCVGWRGVCLWVWVSRLGEEYVCGWVCVCV